MIERKLKATDENGNPEKYVNHAETKMQIFDTHLLTVAVIGKKGSGKSELIMALQSIWCSGFPTLKVRLVELDGRDEFCEILTLGISYKPSGLKRDNWNELLIRIVEISEDTPDEDIIKYTALSSAVLITVDSPTLMETGFGERDLNYSDDMLKFMFHRAALKDKLILFVPVKCEKYMNSTEAGMNMDTLCQRLRVKYKSTVQYLSETENTIAVHPVITEGRLSFKGYDAEGGQQFETVKVKDKTKDLFARFMSNLIFPDSSMPLFHEQLLLTLVRFKVESMVRSISGKKKDKSIRLLLKQRLFRELIEQTRILSDESWDAFISRKTRVCGIKPQQNAQGFAVIYDPKKLFQDIISLKEIKKLL